MENITKRLDKKDVSYLAMLLFFAIVAMFRYFDKKLRNHGAVFPFMEEYPVAILMMFLYFVILFVFYAILIAYCKQENKKTMYYLTAFLSVFAFPMFLPKYYFGNMDMYAWMAAILCCVIFITKKAHFISVILCALMMYISPMSFLNCGILVIGLYLYDYLANTEKRSMYISILSIMSGSVGAWLSIAQNGVNLDVQKVLTVDKFWISVVLLSPYLVIAFLFFKGVINDSHKKKIVGCLVLIFSAIPSLVVNYMVGDYARALVYVFMYFICAVMCLISVQEQEIENQMLETKALIKKHVAIPAIVIVYPLLIMTFWIAGPITLYKEKFLGN